MQQAFLGVDHIDVRVRCLKDVEGFYERLMPALGLPKKRYAHVDENGEWDNDVTGKAYNVVEFSQDPATTHMPVFIGFVEDPRMRPVETRIAFRIASKDDLQRWHAFLRSIGAANVEMSSAPEEYPAVFFEDACGTKLELCARLA